MRTAACLCRALGVRPPAPGPRVGTAASCTKAPRLRGCTHKHTRARSPLACAPVGVGPGQNLPPEQAESVQRVGGRLKPEGLWDGLGGRVGREGDLVQEGQLQGLWLVCLPSEVGNKVTVSAPGRERQRQSRAATSPVSVGVDTTPDYTLLIPASRGIWASHCLPNKSQQTSI